MGKQFYLGKLKLYWIRLLVIGALLLLGEVLALRMNSQFAQSVKQGLMSRAHTGNTGYTFWSSLTSTVHVFTTNMVLLLIMLCLALIPLRHLYLIALYPMITETFLVALALYPLRLINIVGTFVLLAPHAIFEFTAFLIGIMIANEINKRAIKWRKKIDTNVHLSLLFKDFVKYVIPILAFAAIVEGFFTSWITHTVFLK